MSPEELERGRQLVEDLSAILLEPHDLPAFSRAVEQGMSRTGIGRPEEYYRYLKSLQGRDEREHLLEQVLNHETYFFREPQHFEILGRLLPALYRQGGKVRESRMRILSAGCSTGEEPYSIAIALLELTHRLPGLDFEVVGVDISPRALNRAQRGIFGRNSFRNPVARARRDTWFEPAGRGCYKLSSRVMDRVGFCCFDLHADRSLRDALGVMDVIFFRNVLIYLSPASRVRICRNLISALRESGYLFIGTSETLPSPLEGLVLQQVDDVFFWKKEAAEERALLQEELPAASRRRALSLPPGVQREVRSRCARRFETGPDRIACSSGGESALPDRSCSGRKGDEVDTWYVEALKKVREDRKEEALELLDKLLEEMPDHLDACRLMAALHLDSADFEEALLLADRAIEMDATLAWPYVLRGRVSYCKGDAEKAQRELKTAIYYQPDHGPAHFFLAEVYKSLGETRLAVRAYRNTLRNLEKEDRGRELEVDFTGYSKEDIAFACQTNIRSLTEFAT